MANLKAGTLIGGNLIWHQGNLPLQTVDDAIFVSTKEGSKEIYHEGHKPTNEELNLVSRAGDTMTGPLKLKDAELRGTTGALSVKNRFGYIEIGPRTVHNCRIDTDRPEFYFNKEIKVLGGQVYHENHKPTNEELNLVSRAGDTMTGILNVNNQIRVYANTQLNHTLETSTSVATYRTDAPYWRLYAGHTDATQRELIKADGRNGGVVDVWNAKALNPTQLNHAAALTRKDYVDGKFVSKSGDTMTGPLRLIDNPLSLRIGGGTIGSSGGWFRFYADVDSPSSNRGWLFRTIRGDGGLTDIATLTNAGAFNTIGEIKENGQRVYSPNNKPTLDTLTGTATNSDKLDNLDSSQFLRSDADDMFSGSLVSTSRDKGLFGTYDSKKTDQIWSMGTTYKNSEDGSNFGNLYGLAYKHTNNATGGTMAGGHQIVWVTNGTPQAALGDDGIWTSGYGKFGNIELLPSPTNPRIQLGNATSYIAKSGATVYVAANDENGYVIIEGKTHPKVRVGGKDYFLYHEGHKPTPAEVGALSTHHLQYRYIDDADKADVEGVTTYYLKREASNKPTGTDHSLLTMAYSNAWSTQIAGDWRTNRYYVRGQNNGTWSEWAELYSEVNKPTNEELNLVSRAGDTMTGALTFSGHNGIKMKDGRRVLWSHDNGAVTLSASGPGSHLHIGYQNGTDFVTGKVLLNQNLYGTNASTIICDTTGQLYDVGKRVYSEHHKPTPSEIGAWSKTEAPNLSHVGLTSDVKWKATGATVSGTEDVDFNELGGNAGTYHRLTSNASTHRPDNKTGFSYLMSFKYGSTTNTTQLSIPYSVSGNSGRIAFRGKYSGEWNDWEYLYSTNNKPSIQEVTGTLDFGTF